MKPKRTRIVAIRMTEDEYAETKAEARAARVSLSAYLRGERNYPPEPPAEFSPQKTKPVVVGTGITFYPPPMTTTVKLYTQPSGVVWGVGGGGNGTGWTSGS